MLLIMKYLLSLLLLLSSFSFANMDQICHLWIDEKNSNVTPKDQIKKQRCVRNNILEMTVYSDYGYQRQITKWCRFDRQIVVDKKSDKHTGQKVDISCVLYSSEPRDDLRK